MFLEIVLDIALTWSMWYIILKEIGACFDVFPIMNNDWQIQW